MCFAIIRVKYLADNSAQPVVVERAEDLQQRIDDLQSKDQVVSLQVFVRQYDLVLTKEWREQKYLPEPSQSVHGLIKG